MDGLRLAPFAAVFLLPLTVATGTSDAAVLMPCRLSEFSVSPGPYVGEATGQHTLVLELVNRGASVCVLDGYPRVMLYDAAGVIPFVIKNGGDQMISGRRPQTVHVAPGKRVFVVLNKYRCDEGSTHVTTRITIGPPAPRKAAVAAIAFSASHAIPFPYRIPTTAGKGIPVQL